MDDAVAYMTKILKYKMIPVATPYHNLENNDILPTTGKEKEQTAQTFIRCTEESL